MKLKERRHYQIMHRIRDILMESEKFIGVMINSKDLTQPLSDDYSSDELSYTIRLLVHKGYLDPYQNASQLQSVTLTVKGFDEWLFPYGQEDTNRIFFSYAHEDKVLAEKIKEQIEQKGFSVFLAHKDIKPTAEFRDKIISELTSCGIFIALRTKNYSKQYTEQECGFALAMKKKILSLCIDTTPSDMGFCGVYQGHKFTIKEETQLINEITEYCLRQLPDVMNLKN